MELGIPVHEQNTSFANPRPLLVVSGVLSVLRLLLDLLECACALGTRDVVPDAYCVCLALVCSSQDHVVHPCIILDALKLNKIYVCIGIAEFYPSI